MLGVENYKEVAMDRERWKKVCMQLWALTATETEKKNTINYKYCKIG